MNDVFKILGSIFSAQDTCLVVFEALSGKPVYWNKIFEKKTGYPEEMISVQNVQDFFISKEDQTYFQTNLTDLKKENISSFRIIINSKSGEKIVFQFTKAEKNHKNEALIFGVGVNNGDLNMGSEEKSKSSELLKLVLDSIPHYLFWKDLNSTYIGCNDNFARIAGLENSQEVIGKTDYDLVWPAEQSDFYRSVDKKVIESGEPILKYVESQTGADGKVIWIESNKVPIKNTKGEILGVLGNYYDITESKMISDSYEIIAAKFTHLSGSKFFNAVSKYISDKLDMDYVFIGELNNDHEVHVLGGVGKKKIIKTFKYTLEGTPCENVIGQDTCSYPSGVAGLFPTDKDLAEKNIEGYIGTPLFTAEGIPQGIIVMMNEDRIRNEEQKIRFVNTFLDRVSSEIQRQKVEMALHESETKFRNLIEQSNDPIYILSQNRFVLVNKAFKEMFGYSDAELNAEDFHFIEIVAPSHRKAILERAQLVQEGIHPESMYEFKAISKNGREIDCQANISYVDYNGVRSAQGIIRDISKQKYHEAQLKKQKEDYQDLSIRYAVRNDELRESIEKIKEINKELEAAKEKAEESDRLKSAFLANMSHEIRTPMNGIIGFTNILKSSDVDPEKQVEYLEIIETSANRMLNLINDLLDISKIESGLMEVSEISFNLNQLMDSLYDFFRPLAFEKKIEIEVVKDLPEGSAGIISDESKLYQVFTNLINNAIKFTSFGEVVFGYKIKDKNIEFFVKDSGIGIEKDLQDKIFERFRQAEMSFTKEHEGTGLGLAISREMIKMLGGEIYLKSKLNIGSEFIFTLPYRSSSLSEGSFQKPKQLHENFNLKGIEILVVEDDNVSFDLVFEILSGYGIIVTRAYNGEEAVLMVKSRNDFQLILMDVKMPLLNGIEATRELRKINSGIPIIIQSAFTHETEMQLARAAGCDAYLTKPVNRNLLLENILKFIQ